MPQDITVVIWNIQTFGAHKKLRSNSYVPMCSFIANAMHEVSADVLVIQELHESGVPYLYTLREALNNIFQVNTWRYDYIPGAVKGGQVRPIIASDALGWESLAAEEGFAVFWNQSPKFTLLKTREHLSAFSFYSAISLVLSGREIQSGPPDADYFIAPPFQRGASNVNHDLDFFGGANYERTLGHARRPCYCVLELNITNIPVAQRADRLLPIVVYHAPAADRRLVALRRLSVQLASYSGQLYVVDDTTQDVPTAVSPHQAIIGGDFNIDFTAGAATDAYVYRYFTLNFNGGGAECTIQWVPNGPNSQTSVRLRDNDYLLINSANPADFRTLPIDNIFIRNENNNINLTATPPANYNGPIFDLLSAVRTGGALVDTPQKRSLIREFWWTIQAEWRENAALYKYRYPESETPYQAVSQEGHAEGLLVPNLISFDAYMGDLQAGAFNSALTAAEFIYNTISDHAPIVVRFQIA